MRTCYVKLAVLLLLIAGLAVTAGCRNVKDEQVPFSIEIDSIQIEGSVSDSLSQAVTVSLDGSPVSLVGGDFDETIDMTGRTGFTLEAEDETGNTSSLTIEVQ